MSPEGVLIQDASGAAYRIPADRLSEFAVDTANATAGTVVLSVPGDGIVEELPTQRRAMLQTAS